MCFPISYFPRVPPPPPPHPHQHRLASGLSSPRIAAVPYPHPVKLGFTIVPLEEPQRSPLDAAQLQLRGPACTLYGLYVYVYVYMYMHVYVFMYVFMYVYMYMYMYVYVYVYMYMYVYVYMYMYVCMQLDLRGTRSLIQLLHDASRGRLPGAFTSGF
ncbi:unnamed protein product [Menidia menidia]|uniref:(Atlantic silverside) hypothetical protein n=1 Tax=Menidia menidia TaxID=238744 RepID=A0A8S4B493_9TELE|nr:unnamed protein product [Menidia menidia]